MENDLEDRSDLEIIEEDDKVIYFYHLHYTYLYMYLLHLLLANFSLLYLFRNKPKSWATWVIL